DYLRERRRQTGEIEADAANQRRAVRFGIEHVAARFESREDEAIDIGARAAFHHRRRRPAHRTKGPVSRGSFCGMRFIVRRSWYRQRAESRKRENRRGDATDL